jgi:hypothetical protein
VPSSFSKPTPILVAVLTLAGLGLLNLLAIGETDLCCTRPWRR